MAERAKLKDPKSILESIKPQERLKQLKNYSDQVDVDPNVPPLRYYRSGMEMVRMANVYHKEGSLENAYVLYLKFMTLFVEKIRNHPEYGTVPVEVKSKNQAKLREIFPKAEQLKQQLLDQYTEDYKNFLAEIKQHERDEKKKEKPKKEDKQTDSVKSLPKMIPAIITAKVPSTLDDINYPDPDVPGAPPPTKTASSGPSVASVPTWNTVPSIDRSKKPLDTIQTPFDSSVLRNVVVPVKVMTLFQAMAQSNTFKNIETCGALAGKLEKNELIVTHMIVPKQKGTSDSCVTMNEEELFDYQDQHNLITLGWIHTHPTQTAFLSSVDLHTHCPYQLLMPEAIAIVCSPKYNDTGFFHLTPKYGLQYIANCRKTGFHPHPTDPPLFTSAEHVKIDNNAPLEVLDFRKQN